MVKQIFSILDIWNGELIPNIFEYFIPDADISPPEIFAE